MYSDLLILAPAGLVLLFLVLRRWQALATPPPARGKLPPNAIVVDGSNVMHWGGAPSATTIIRVLGALEAKGYSPIAIFDASAGYKLSNKYMHHAIMSKLIGLPERQVLVVNKGVSADEVILDFATTHKLRIVTNDNFREWRVRFPHAASKGVLVKGTFAQGAVKWRGTL